MPTTTFPAPHGSTALNDEAMPRTNLWFPWPESFDDLRPTHISNPGDLFRHSCGNHTYEPDGVSDLLTSTFGSVFDRDAGTLETAHNAPHGFYAAVIKAYFEHLHLVIRTDDVWISILTQLNMYITENAEKLRYHFVAHKGQEILNIQVRGDGKEFMASRAFSGFVDQMTNAMQERIVDNELRTWVLPDFATTREREKIVVSTTFMGAISKYFKYRMEGTGCGLPSVTLLGEREDWVKILEKLPKIKSLDQNWRSSLRFSRPF
jgi:hypothetical protein